MTFPNRATWQGNGWLDLWWVRKGGGVKLFCGTTGGYAVRKLQQKLIEANYPAQLAFRVGARLVSPSALRADGVWGELTQHGLIWACSQPQINADTELLNLLRRDVDRRTISRDSQKMGLIVAYHPSLKFNELELTADIIPPGWGQQLGTSPFDSGLRTWEPGSNPPVNPADPNAPPAQPATPPRPTNGNGNVGGGSPLTLPSSNNSTQQDAGLMGLVKQHPIATGAAAIGIFGGIGYAVVQTQKSNAAKAKQPSRAPQVGAGNRR